MSGTVVVFFFDDGVRRPAPPEWKLVHETSQSRLWRLARNVIGVDGKVLQRAKGARRARLPEWLWIRHDGMKHKRNPTKALFCTARLLFEFDALVGFHQSVLC